MGIWWKIIKWRKSFNYFKEQIIDTHTCWNYAYETYQFLEVSQPQLKGETVLKFIGTNFLSRSELKKWKAQLSAAKNKLCRQNEYYFVTLWKVLLESFSFYLVYILPSLKNYLFTMNLPVIPLREFWGYDYLVTPLAK